MFAFDFAMKLANSVYYKCYNYQFALVVGHHSRLDNKQPNMLFYQQLYVYLLWSFHFQQVLHMYFSTPGIINTMIHCLVALLTG